MNKTSPIKKGEKEKRSEKAIIFFEDGKTALVRPMQHTKKDYAGIARCYNSFKDSDSWPGGFGGAFIFDVAFIEEQFKTRDLTTHFIVVAPDDPEKIVGLSFCFRTWNLPDSWYVQFLGVDPAYQGQKLGKALLLRSTKFALEKQARFISLHTWGGNLKAMPLYKRQGYKWRPNTSAYMENYIPQILNYPYFRELFTIYSWYDTFKPNITQEQDREFDEKMAIYEYFFELSEHSSLKIWIDRTVGRISGFHKKTEDEDLLVKASTPNSEAFTGIEEFPVTLTLANKGKDTKKLSIIVTATSQLKLKGGSTFNIKLSPNEEQVINLTGSFLLDTDELDMRVHTHTYSDHEIIFKVSCDGLEFPITVGKVPLNAIKIQTSPMNFTTIPNHTLSIPLELRNFMSEKKDVEIEVLDGNHVVFEKHHFSVSVDPYDSYIEIPAKIKPTSTTADAFQVSVKSSDGQKMLEKTLPIVIFDKNKLVSYELDRQLFVENKYIRVSLYKKPQPGSNELFIVDKLRGLKIYGNSIVLGYPFDDEGSEFFTKELEHEIVEAADGLCLVSSAGSDVKEGIKVTRKLFIPEDNESLAIQFSLENLSDKTITDLGIKCPIYWWPGQFPFINIVYPLHEGIVHYNIQEIEVNFGNEPSNFAEGWKATEFTTGTIGIMFDPKSIDKIRVQSFPWIEHNVPELKSGQRHNVSKVWYCFTDTWQMVRKIWQDKYHPSPMNRLVPHLFLKDMQKIGLMNERTGDTICKGLILDRNQEKIAIVIDAFRKTNFRGKLELNFDEITVTPSEFLLTKAESKQWRGEISLSAKKGRIESGKITFDTLTRIYQIPVTLGFYDSKKQVIVKKVEHDKGEYLEVDNGFLTFKGSKDYRGQIFHLSAEEGENCLLTHYPEVKPFLWSSEFYGGLGGVIRPEHGWDDEDFNRLKFESYEVQKGLWKGIGFKSAVIEYSPKIKGLQLTTNFLTLPDSPFILVQQEITNHSELTRTFDAFLTASFATSKTDKDKYYVKSKEGEIATFRMQEYRSYVWREKDLEAKWSAYQKDGSEYLIGVIINQAKYNESINAYAPNLSIYQLGRFASSIQIKPKETICLNVLYLLTDTLDKIEPFTQNNIEDLLNF